MIIFFLINFKIPKKKFSKQYLKKFRNYQKFSQIIVLKRSIYKNIYIINKFSKKSEDFFSFSALNMKDSFKKIKKKKYELNFMMQNLITVSLYSLKFH